MVDLSKAFDSVKQGILLKKIYPTGIRAIFFNLLESYLTDRVHFTKVRDHDGDHVLSDPLTVKRGVPQCSILDPLFFFIYVNDMEIIIRHYMYLYANDRQ